MGGLFQVLHTQVGVVVGVTVSVLQLCLSRVTCVTNSTFIFFLPLIVLDFQTMHHINLAFLAFSTLLPKNLGNNPGLAFIMNLIFFTSFEIFSLHVPSSLGLLYFFYNRLSCVLTTLHSRKLKNNYSLIAKIL